MLVAAVLVLAVAVPASAATFAIADDAAQRAFPSELASARGIGFGAARMYVGWADVAARRPLHPRDPSDPAYDWSQSDADVARYRAAGLAVWIQLWRTPAWASGSADTAVWATSPSDLGDFAYAVARRYPQVRVFMDWNEPNLKLYANPNTLAAYEPMARAVYAGVKAADPSAEVIAGGFARYRDGGRDPVVWAAALRADGVPMDAFGINPYPDVAKPLAARSPRARIDLFDVPALARIAGVPVAVTEFGWSSQLAGLQNQATWTAQAIVVARCTPGLSQVVFWGYHDHPVPVGQTPDPWVRYGWLDENGNPKPVYAAGTAALAGTPDCAAITGAPAGWPATSTIPAPDSAPVCSVPALVSSGEPVSAAVACTDADGDRLTVAVSSTPAHGALALTGLTATYTPEAGFAGDDAFTLTVSDGILRTALPVAVSVIPPLPPPVAPLPALLASPMAPLVAPAGAPLVLPAVATAVAAVARASGLAVLGRDVLSIGVACSAGTGSCAMRVAVSARLGGVTRSLGARSLTLAAGRRATARLSLGRPQRRWLRRRAGRTLRVRVVVTGAGAVPRTATIAVRVPR